MILGRKILKDVAEELKKNGNKLVFTNGCFDIIHPGHVDYLKKAKRFGDILIIGINTDASVKRLKGKTRPLNTQEDRAAVLEELRPVDIVTFFHEDTPLELVSELIPDIIVKGGDYKADEVVGGDIVRENGGRIEIIPYVEGKSTTGIINKMNEK